MKLLMIDILLVIGIIKLVFEKITFFKEYLIGTEVNNSTIIIVIVFFLLIYGISKVVFKKDIYKTNTIKLKGFYFSNIDIKLNIIENIRLYLQKSNFIIILIMIILIHSLNYGGEMDMTVLKGQRINYYLLKQENSVWEADGQNQVEIKLNNEIENLKTKIFSKINLINRTEYQKNDIVKNESLNWLFQFKNFLVQMKNNTVLFFTKDGLKTILENKGRVERVIKVENLPLFSIFYFRFRFIINKYKGNAPIQNETISQRLQRLKNIQNLTLSETRVESDPNFWRIYQNDVFIANQIPYQSGLKINYAGVYKSLETIINNEIDEIQSSHNFPIWIIKKIPDNLNNSEKQKNEQIASMIETRYPYFFEQTKVLYISTKDSQSDPDWIGHLKNNYDTLTIEFDHLGNMIKDPDQDINRMLDESIKSIKSKKNSIGYIDANIRSPYNRFLGIFLLYCIYLLIKIFSIHLIPDFNNKDLS